MGARVKLQVPGIGEVGGWLARPEGPPQGGVVVLQEIFGVNAHMRAVTDRYAREGLLALAPALFDPVERDAELTYDEAGFEGGRALAAALGFDRAVAVAGAAASTLSMLLAPPGGRPAPATRVQASPEPGEAADRRVAAVGFCWGGSVAFLANTRLGLPAVSYYGARTLPVLDEPLRAPMLFHFGARDHSIPPADIEAHRRAHPQAELHVYDAGHGFNRDVDPRHHDPASARLAHVRTLDFLQRAFRPGAGH
ncbi:MULTISPECIES: dienelactone hydrolase family protein [unclassified Luteimonas]|uniref:dienelactone hydrolase family protein n=1 Tax=unclassified Luteimonas TaxID=2629088 RepID=UPI0018F07863|nr:MULTISPECIES: dienelactone hydrolase family protein [unclassified Luteimonas]MBJ6978173.1 dienelactone hydrolase family protein [Luteimonas sp. MC1895]MBJ6984121.1 dienelactone hydrolase family protein [Luteimonas sp. MC1750]QQO06925.1 dienelactone hydrolase family protein [Luteimonas sp. MC1750]